MMKKSERQDKFSNEKNGGKTDPVQVTLNVTPAPISPARKQAWRKFWTKLIAEAKRAATENSSSDGSG